MLKFITICFLFVGLMVKGQQPDAQGYIVYKEDTIYLKGTVRVKPVEPPPPPPVSLCDKTGIRRYLTPSIWGGLYLNAASYKCNPGDTLVISNKYTWAGLDIENFHGSATCPIVIISDEGVNVSAGVKMKHCTYIKVTGLKIHGNGTGPGIDITGRSAYIEIEKLDVWKKFFGIWCKQEADCPDSLKYPNWWIDNISIHDSKFVNIASDGLYLGSTSPTGQRSVSCNGVVIYPIPLRLSNIKVYNCLVDSCGRTGIQLSGADRGVNEIYNNVVTRSGFELNQTQGDGIAIGGMSRAYVHDNIIDSVFKYGVFCLGAGLSRIERNKITNCGYLGKIVNTGSKPSNILTNTLPTVPVNDSTTLIIANNVFGKNCAPNGENIVIYNNAKLMTANNRIYGNVRIDGVAAKLQNDLNVKYSTQ